MTVNVKCSVSSVLVPVVSNCDGDCRKDASSPATTFNKLTYPQIRTVTVVFSTLIGVLEYSKFENTYNIFRDAQTVMDTSLTLSLNVRISNSTLDDLREAAELFSEYVTFASVPALIFAPTFAGILLELKKHNDLVPLSSQQILAEFLKSCPSAKHIHLYMAQLVADLQAIYATEDRNNCNGCDARNEYGKIV